MGKQKGDSSKATIFATAFPAPGKEPQWEQAIGELIRASSTFPGYQGSIVWLAVYATVLPVIAILKPWTTELPALLASALLAAVTVAMMTWIVLPFLTWLFKAWLYPSHQEQP